MDRSEQHIRQIDAAIRAQAEQQSRAIIDEANHSKEQTLREHTERVVDDMCIRVRDGVQDCRQQALRNVSRAEREQYASLLRRREELTGTVFADTAQALREFAAGPEYAPWLLRLLRELEPSRADGAVISLRREDLELTGQITGLLPGCHVRESGEIRLGGFILENERLGIRVDETLEARLAGQRPRFLMQCGLRVRREKGEAE